MTTHENSPLRRDLHPAASRQTERMLVARQVDYVFEPNLELRAIRISEGHQVRFGDNRTPKKMVDHYAEQMRRGAVFPAIVVTEQFGLIDGNTRCAAAAKNRAGTLAAYVCSGMTPLETRSLSIELNQIHGLRMTDDEIRGFIVGCVHHGVEVDVGSYARMTGIKATLLARWIAVERYRVRTAKLGLPSCETRRLLDPAAAVLEGARLDAVFAAATKLAIETGPSAAQLKAVITTANAAPSEDEALAIVAVNQGRRSAVGMRHSSSRWPRRSAMSGLHLGGLLRFSVDELLDVAPLRQRETFAGLCMVRDLLDAAVTTAERTWNINDRDTSSSRELVKVT